MVKVRSFRLQQCFDPFAMFSVEGSSETQLVRHLNNPVFRSREFWKYMSYDTHLFFGQCSKFKKDFENAKKNWEKVLFFLDTWIWIGCVKLSLLSKQCLSPAVNVLRNSLRILHMTKRHFLQWNCLYSY